MNPKVSVIIPNYNHSKFLTQRIDSVLNQTYQDFEIILLDDYSTDGSIEILRALKNHPKVSHIIFNEINSGSPFKQWEKGISLACGEYIWIAESDDYASVHFLEKLIPKLEEGFGVAYCRSAVATVDNQINENYFWPDGLDYFKWKKDFHNKGIDELKCSFIYRNVIPNASSCVFKKVLVPNFEKINVKKYAGDWLFWAYVLRKSSIYFCAESLNFFRAHDDSTRKIKNREKELLRLSENLDTIDEIKKICYEDGDFKIHYSKYNWLFVELIKRKQLLSVFQYLFPPLPLRMLIEYYRFQKNNWHKVF